MTSIDPKQLEYLRDLPSGYLIDLLAAGDLPDDSPAYMVLRERGLTAAEIEAGLTRRRQSRWPGRPFLWRIARWTMLGLTLLLGLFNTAQLTPLVLGDDPLKIPILFFAILCSGFGFFVGYKLTALIYQGESHRLYCGFPVPIGSVDLHTCREQLPPTAGMVWRMAVNAFVGVNLTLFPLLLLNLLVR
ncbi:MAG: hypothetical protein RQ723_04635 [Desulfuromonadales bacterium]|nr:hypothetical protein [Desulfuromonadales bacterium]